MQTLERLDAAGLRRAMSVYRDLLRSHQEELNGLNVYPVPDGDTGTNMALTLEAVVAELDQAGEDMNGVGTAICHGSLMGARGNSGVILSQLLRGLVDGLKHVDEADGPTLANALAASSTAAHGAVLEPVEGTILTVVRDTAEAAVSVAAKGSTVLAVLEAAAAAARTSVERTPELLPVLAAAGVVDAGGAGFALLIDALLHVVDQRPLPKPTRPVREAAPPTAHRQAGAASPSELRYEVMFFLDAPDERIPGFKAAWAAVGGSIAVVGGDGLWNCHIHTADIGAAIEAGIEAGRPRSIRITDLFEQVDQCAPGHQPPAPADVTTAVVAVAAGDGIREILRSMGVAAIVAGGQSMNPSTAELLEAVVATGAGSDTRGSAAGVVLLPNNPNVVAVARKAAEAAGTAVGVVETKSIPEALAALVAYDAGVDLETNVQAMSSAAERSVAGEVVQAVRDASTPAGPVRTGEWLGIGPDGIVAVSATSGEAGCALFGLLVGDRHEVVTILEGDDADPPETAVLTEWLAAHRPEVAIEIHWGGQPRSAYFIGIE